MSLFLCLSSTILDTLFYVYNNRISQYLRLDLGSRRPGFLGVLSGILFTVTHCFSGLVEVRYTRESQGRGHMHLRKSVMELGVRVTVLSEGGSPDYRSVCSSMSRSRLILKVSNQRTLFKV